MLDHMQPGGSQGENRSECMLAPDWMQVRDRSGYTVVLDWAWWEIQATAKLDLGHHLETQK